MTSLQDKYAALAAAEAEVARRQADLVADGPQGEVIQEGEFWARPGGKTLLTRLGGRFHEVRIQPLASPPPAGGAHP